MESSSGWNVGQKRIAFGLALASAKKSPNHTRILTIVSPVLRLEFSSRLSDSTSYSPILQKIGNNAELKRAIELLRQHHERDTAEMRDLQDKMETIIAILNKKTKRKFDVHGSKVKVRLRYPCVSSGVTLASIY